MVKLDLAITIIHPTIKEYKISSFSEPLDYILKNQTMPLLL